MQITVIRSDNSVRSDSLDISKTLFTNHMMQRKVCSSNSNNMPVFLNESTKFPGYPSTSVFKSLVLTVLFSFTRS
jgi:hypothetical protein